MIKKHTILRILLLLSLFGIPGIVKFDRSGLTHDYGLFNTQSLLRIVFYLFLGYIIIIYLFTIERLKISSYWINKIKVPFMFYIFSLAISIPILSFNDILLSTYFIYEWLLFLVILYLYQKQIHGINIHQAINDIVLLIWLKIIALLIILPFFPSLTMMGNDIYRLGGYFLGPNVLGTISGMLAFYYYYYYKGDLFKKYSLFLFLVIILILTNSRGAIFSFIIAYSFTLLLSKQALNKIILSYFIIISIILIKINMNFLLRGLDFKNIITLSDRIPLWFNYYIEFFKSPLIGFGFIVGVKNLSMIIPEIHWVAPHAHNDFVQALMSGGIIMSIFTIYLYLSTYKNLLSSKINEDMKLVLHSWLILIFIYAMLTPIINWKLFTISGFFWIINISLTNEVDNENINCS